MTTISTTELAYQFKRVYGDKITDLFNRQVMTYNLFNKSSRKARFTPAGAGYYFSTRQADIESVGARVEGAYLPEPLPGAGSQGVILPKLEYAVIRMSGLAIAAGKGNVASFVEAQSDATMSAYKSLITDLNRQCHNDGFGQLAVTSAIATPSDSQEWTVTFDNDVGVRYLRRGMICDLYSAAGTAVDQTASSVRISAINPTTRVVTFETMANSYRARHPITDAQSYTNTTDTIESGSRLVRYGAREATHATTDTHREMMGLLGMYDDSTLITTFEGINAATNLEWRANILGNGGVNRDITIDDMLAAMDMTAARSTEQVGIIRMGLGQRRKYFGLLAPDVRYSPGRFLGGYEKLEFAQNAAVSILVDPHTQPNRMFFEPDNVVKKYELTPIGWGGLDGLKMHWREDYDEGTMFLRTYTNLGVENRVSLTLLKDLVEPTTGNPF